MLTAMLWQDVDAGTDPHAGHAILHDFCMVIPYGLILGVAGVIALLFKVLMASFALILHPTCLLPEG